MPDNNQLYSQEEFAGLIRKKHPNQYDHWTDDKLTQKWLQDYPVYNKVVDNTPKVKEYDPSIGDHINKAWYNFKSMGVEIPAAAVGMTTKILQEDSEARETVLGFSEKLRKWGQDKQNEWIENDPGIQGYLEWQKDKPISLKNFWHFDMMLRGVSDLAPSIATMMMGAGGVSVGLKAVGAGAKMLKYGTQAGSMMSMGALEGSGEYNEAMRYLVEEKGVKPNEAVDTAANAAVAVGIGNGLLEYYGINRLAKLSGMAGKDAKKMLTTKMVDKLTDNRFLNKTGDVLTNAVVEGLTEGTQSINQELVQNVYKKYDGDVDQAFDNFIEDFKHSAFAPETVESYWSALSGTLLMGGVGASTSTFSRRMLDNFKDKQLDDNISDDTSGLETPTGVPTRSKRGVNLAQITYGDEGITTDEKQVLLDAKIDAQEAGGNALKNRIEDSIDYVVENGTAAFEENNIDRTDFINSISNIKNDVQISDEKIQNLEKVLNEINQAEIEASAEAQAQEEYLEAKSIAQAEADISVVEEAEKVKAEELTLDQMAKEAKIKQEKDDVKIDDDFKYPGEYWAKGGKAEIVVLTDKVFEIKDGEKFGKSLDIDTVSDEFLKQKRSQFEANAVERGQKDNETPEKFYQRTGDKGSLETLKMIKSEQTRRKRLGLTYVGEAGEAVAFKAKKDGKGYEEIKDTEKTYDRKFEKTWGVKKGERPFKGAMFVSDGVTYEIDKVKSVSGEMVKEMNKDILSFAEEGVSSIEDIISKEDFEEGDLYQMYDLTQWTDKDGKKIEPKPVFDVPINALVKAGYTIVNKPGEKADPDKIISPIKGEYKQAELFESADEVIKKEVDKAIDKDLTPLPEGYKDIDFQQVDKTDKAKIKDNKEVANKLASKLKKQFPFVKAKAIEKVFNEEGQEVAGRAFKNIVEWSTTQGTLDTIPHEYGHIYIKIMGNHPVIKEGLKRFGGEENLVQYIGDYYAGKIQDKGLVSRLKTWLRKWTNALKNFFGMALTDKELGDLISEKFYSFKMKESDLYTIKNNKVEYQEIKKPSKKEQAVIQQKFNTMMNDIESQVRKFNKSSDTVFKPIIFIDQVLNRFEKEKKNWIPLFYNWMSQHKDETFNGVANIGQTADGESFISKHVKLVGDTESIEAIAYKTRYLVDNVTDNEIAVSEAEVDARENVQRGIDRSLTLLGDFKITVAERNKLYDAANAKDFDEWYREDLASLLAFKKKDIKQLNQAQNDAAAQLHTFLHNRILVNQEAGAGNAINYIRFDKQWNGQKKEFIYKIKLVGPEERVFKSDYSMGIVKQQSQYDTNLIAHSKPHLSALLRQMYFVTNKMFNQIETIEKDAYYMLHPDYKFKSRKSYKFLNSEEVRALENVKVGGVVDPFVFLFSRGDSAKIATGIVQGKHFDISKDSKLWDKFWTQAEAGGYINKKQKEIYLSWKKKDTQYDIIARARAIAAFDYINSFVPGWVNRDFADVLKRMKVPLTPAFTNKKVPDGEARYIPASRIQFSVGDGPKHNGTENIGPLKNTYEGDGNTITSRRYVRSVAKAYGIDRAIGWLKSVVYDVDPYLDDKGNIIPLNDVNMLMLKHQHSVPEAGLKIWNNNTLVGEVDSDGNIRDPKGNIIDMIMTGDERKMASGHIKEDGTGYVDSKDPEGKERTVEFTIPGSAFGLIKMSVGKKNTVKFPLQWMNYITDMDLIADLIEAFTGPNSRADQILRTLMMATRSPEKIKILADKLKSKFKEDFDTDLYNDIMASGGLIPRDAGRLEITTRGKILDPAVNLGEQMGIPLYFAPNYARDLKVDELAVDMKAITSNRQLMTKFRKDTNITGKPTFKQINKWLDKNDIRVLAYRSPIAYAGGVNYLRIKRLTNVNGTVQIHRDTTFLGYEGDYDGDALYIMSMPDNMNEKLKDYFQSKEFTDSIEGVDLKKYIGKRNKFNPLHPSDRSQMIEAMVYSNTAIGEIASSSLIFGLIRNSMISATIVTKNNDTEIIVPNTGIIDMGNGVKGTADKVLRIYLQAAVDNPKFLLLKDWNYNVTDFRKKLFKTKAGLTLDAFDVESDSGWITNDVWTAFNEVIWKRYKIASNIRNLNTVGGDNNSVEGIINDSQNYARFVNARLNKTLPNTKAIMKDGHPYNVTVTWNNNVGLLEKAVTKVYEMFDKYVESGPQGSDSRKSPLRFDQTTYEAAHMQAKENMDINSKLEILRNKIGNTKFNAAQSFARSILKDSETAMTSEAKNRRPLQPNSWQTNPDLVNIIIEQLEPLKDKSIEGQEIVTLIMLKEIKNSNLDLLPPHAYLHKSVNQYYKENTKYLRGEPTAQEASDVSLNEAKRRNCD